MPPDMDIFYFADPPHIIVPLLDPEYGSRVEAYLNTKGWTVGGWVDAVQTPVAGGRFHLPIFPLDRVE